MHSHAISSDMFGHVSYICMPVTNSGEISKRLAYPHTQKSD